MLQQSSQTVIFELEIDESSVLTLRKAGTGFASGLVEANLKVWIPNSLLYPNIEVDINFLTMLAFFFIRYNETLWLCGFVAWKS